MRSAKFKTLYGTFYKHCYIAINNISYEQRLHFRWVSWHVKSSLSPTTVQFSIVHARNSSRDSQAKLTALNRSRTGKIVFFNVFVQISGRNWTVVGRGYFAHNSSHSENVASARRVQIKMKCLTLLLYMLQFLSFSDCFKAFLKTY